MAQLAERTKPSLPQRWADEIAHAAPPTTQSHPETLGGRLFDSKLDGFLERFQQEIVAARALKDALDRIPQGDEEYLRRKEQFKNKMDRIRQLFVTEGEDFVSSLEKRNPKLTIAACGENTIELAQGIERLETAVKEEETKRAAKANVVENVTPEGRTAEPANNGPAAVGQTLGNLNSDETLQLMQSDIQALKLELMRLQRSKETATGYQTLPLPFPPSKPTVSVEGGLYSVESLTRETDDNKGLPPSLLANNVSVVRVTGRANGMAPTYVSHLEQMKTRLEALEKRPLTRRAKSAARLGRTHTVGSMYDHPDENQNPNVVAMVTPPRGNRRNPRSVSAQSPSSYTNYSPPLAEKFVHISSPGSSPSPVRKSLKNGDAPNGTSPARLFFDAPEDMLSRPQSHAAAKDIQRYSLKVARRFGPSEHVALHSPEPRSKSLATTSPSRKQAMHGEGGPLSHTLSDVANNALHTSPSTVDTSGSGGRVVEEIEGDMWIRKGVVWKRWRRRYASIVSHQFFGKVMCLFSYDSSGGRISTRSQIVVLQGSLCRALRDNVEIGGEQRHVFVLRTSTKEYYFAAETDEIRRNWIRELRDAARNDNARFVPAVKGRSMAFRNRFS